MTVLTPVVQQNCVSATSAESTPVKTTQAGMSGIQALAAAAAATQKITVSPQTAQLKLGNLIDSKICVIILVFVCVFLFSFFPEYNSTTNTR